MFVAAAVAVVAGLGIAVAYTNGTPEKAAAASTFTATDPPRNVPTTTPAAQPTEPVATDPAKTEPPAAPPPTQSGPRDVDVFLTYAGYMPESGGGVAGGYADAVTENDGTCTLTLTKGRHHADGDRPRRTGRRHDLPRRAQGSPGAAVQRHVAGEGQLLLAARARHVVAVPGGGAVMPRAARSGRRRFLLAPVAIVLTLVAGLVTVETSTAPSSSPARAADLSQFNPGNIIADRVFYDNASMSAAQIQDFLVGKGGWIRNFRQTTATKAADSFCRGYTGAANENAGTIIKKVADSCGINPRVLIVTLQKERGLITDTVYDARDYQIAMGYGCPDTAACASTYYGFENQLYSASKQFKRYAASPTKYAHRAGVTNNVRYYPNTACGSSPVFITTRRPPRCTTTRPTSRTPRHSRPATAPANSCSSYGNRNFFHWFVDWFGSTRPPGRRRSSPPATPSVAPPAPSAHRRPATTAASRTAAASSTSSTARSTGPRPPARTR